MSRKSALEQKHPDLAADGLIEQLANGDPSGSHKYLGWMVKMFTAVGHPAEEIIESIQRFHYKRPRLDPSLRDVYRFKTLDDLHAALATVEDTSQRQQRQAQKRDGAVCLFNDDKIAVHLICEAKGARIFGRGTNWCITQDVHFREYTKNSSFIFITNKTKEPKTPYSKFALQVPSNRLAIFHILSLRQIYDIARRAKKLEQKPYRQPLKHVYNARDFSSAAHFEIVEALVGHDRLHGFIDQAVSGNIESHYIQWIQEAAESLKKRSISADRFIEIAKKALEYRAFRPASLFHHRMAADPEVASRLWDVHLQDPTLTQAYEHEVLLKTHAKKNVRFIESALRSAASAAYRRIFSKIFDPNGHSKESKARVIKYINRTKNVSVIGYFIQSKMCTHELLHKLYEHAPEYEFYSSRKLKSEDLDFLVDGKHIRAYPAGTMLFDTRRMPLESKLRYAESKQWIRRRPRYAVALALAMNTKMSTDHLKKLKNILPSLRFAEGERATVMAAIRAHRNYWATMSGKRPQIYM